MVTQEQTAKAKIRALAQGVRVYVLEPGIRYVVPSCSDDGTAYEVHVHLSGDIDCNCKAGVHGRPCKHLAAVQMRVEAEKDIQSAQQSNTGYRTCPTHQITILGGCPECDKEPCQECGAVEPTEDCYRGRCVLERQIRELY
jgi:hypothetical protein